ncbi:MAG: TetR/AcrR family transcriptional regulator [Gammaproteobacteria bacterium]|nr:TetR/AcrR family transcriptional regulator [Gammaproteobacteria bacterium]
MARPIQFDRDQVIDRAMQAFWDQGYCATSISSLVQATRLNPGSIYAAFKSKEGLFLAALDRYGEQSLIRLSRTLESAASPLQGIRDYLRQLAASSADPEHARGCFLVNSVLELAHRDDKVRQHVNRHFGAIEACLKGALQESQRRGELAAAKDPEALAACLMSGIWGLRVLGGTGPDAGRTGAVVEQLLTLLD